jgi:hypothetical protein
MKKLYIILAALLLIVPALTTYAQEQDDAFAVWNCVKMDKSLGKDNKWNVGLVTEYRHKFHEGVSKMDMYFVRPHVSYKVLPWLKLQYQMDFISSSSGFNWCFLPEVTMSHKVGDFTLTFRQRALTTWKVKAGTNSTVLRSRAKVEYRIPDTPLGFHLSTEPYWCDFSKDSFAWFQKLRTHVGMTIRLTENLSLTPDYGWIAYFNHAGKHDRRTYDDHVLYLTLAVKL